MYKKDKRLTIIILSFIVILIIFLYSGLKSGKNKENFSTGTPKVGIVNLKGVIYNSEKIVKELNNFKKRNDIKAIVLRIDTPGGGVAASQEIYEAVKKVRDSGKPVVASIGSVGASGGYYAAIGASTIMANPGSITASIGVIANFPVMNELLDFIGIKYKTVKSGKYKDTGSPFRTFTEQDSLRFQNTVDDLYNQFLQVVIKERQIEKNDLIKSADGRILTGLQALQVGLIDTLGTRDDAIMLAAKFAGIEGEPKVVSSKKEKVTLYDLLFNDIEEVKALIRTEPSVNYILK